MPRLVTERADTLPALAVVFRECGYNGASLALISEHTRLGKGSLYHFFPGGKEEMADAVLGEIDAWFESNIFSPLANEANPVRGIRHMMQAVDVYFESGERICIVGAFALNNIRDLFADRIRSFFSVWVATLSGALRRGGVKPSIAEALAEETIGAIQGALVMSRAFEEPQLFRRMLNRNSQRLVAAMVHRPA